MQDSEMATILIVEDKKSMAEMLRASLEAEGYKCVLAGDGETAVSLIKKEVFDLIISDLKLPGRDGLEVLRAVQEEDPSVPVIIMTAFGTIETAVQAMREGAFDFITKPFDMDHLLVLIRRALEQKRLFRENILLREERTTKDGIPTIIGSSPVMQSLIEKVKKVAKTRSTVLLLGESGTGKELFARAIHHLSPRADGMFVPVNCAAIPRDLLESELFGHEKGAFTGASSRRLGKFELAHGGTIFLDEIAELELSLQAKLLRVLQDHRIERIGGTKLIQVDVRVIAASNTDLAKAVKEGRFREDLFYRLNVFPVEIPPLRERKEDIPLLVEFFIEKFSKEMKTEKKTITEEALKLLMEYNWKGNVRELENTIERAMILADGPEIQPKHISLLGTDTETCLEALPMDGPLEETTRAALKIAESIRIKRALERSRWNKTKAAEELKISYKTLLTKIKEYGLE